MSLQRTGGWRGRRLSPGVERERAPPYSLRCVRRRFDKLSPQRNSSGHSRVWTRATAPMLRVGNVWHGNARRRGNIWPCVSSGDPFGCCSRTSSGILVIIVAFWARCWRIRIPHCRTDSACFLRTEYHRGAWMHSPRLLQRALRLRPPAPLCARWPHSAHCTAGGPLLGGHSPTRNSTPIHATPAATGPPAAFKHVYASLACRSPTRCVATRRPRDLLTHASACIPGGPREGQVSVRHATCTRIYSGTGHDHTGQEPSAACTSRAVVYPCIP
jgi:hypothetical protein